MKNSGFVMACVLVFSAIIALHGLMAGHLASVSHQKNDIKSSALIEQKAQAELRTVRLQEQLFEFQQTVAASLPKALPKNPQTLEQYQLRKLASVIQTGDTLQILKGSSLLEEAKKQFRKKEFRKASANLAHLIHDYPDSSLLLDAYFLQSEALFQLKKYDDSLSVIESMVTLFPENEATGYALLRLGKIYEQQERSEDAADIYRAVIKHYSTNDLKVQGSKMLKAVEL
jgi:TolA-binding protein